MENWNIIATIGAVAAVGTAGYFLMNENKRNMLLARGGSIADKFEKNEVSTLDEAGIPDQTGNLDSAQFENAKMVSEGSQFGVNYFNEVTEKK